ncbi:hypothetical protein FRC10_005096, partial [Ceratobasidium sp. 414]
MEGGEAEGSTKRKRGGGKGKKSKGKGQEEEQEEQAGPVQTIAMSNTDIWQKMSAALESACDELRIGDADEARRAKEISEWRIGCATLRFAGIGTVEGVVKLSDDPNERDNPRELQGSHVSVLAEVFKAGGKKDLQSPIRITVPRHLISDALARQMRDVNVHDPSTKIPRLVLERETAHREDELEREIWLESDGKVLLGTDDLAKRVLELRELREERQRATLLNGNHRIAAMRTACVPLFQEQRDIIRRLRAGESAEELTERVNRLTEQVRHANYVVEVFDGERLRAVFAYRTLTVGSDKAPQYIVSWLSQNEEDRPNLAPRSGEKLWQLTRHQEAWARLMVERGEAVDRAEALDKLYSVKDMGARFDKLSQKEMEWAAAIDVRPGQGDDARRDGELSQKACRELMGHPLLNDMVLDTWAASLLYNARLNMGHVQAMKKDGGGACFAIHFWMGAKILIKTGDTSTDVSDAQIFNVAGGERHLAAAETFLERLKDARIPVEGREDAVAHWEALHSREQNSPAPLQQLVEADLTSFETVLKDEFKRGGLNDPDRDDQDTTSLGHRYESDEFVSAVRNMYTRFAARFDTKKTPHGRLVAASLRLYALLPRWAVGCGDNRFFPAAILPTKSRYAAIEKRVDGAQDSTGLCLVSTPVSLAGAPRLTTPARVPDGPGLPAVDLRRYRVLEFEELGSLDREDTRRAQGRALLRSVAVAGLQALTILESPELIEAHQAAEEYDTELAALRQKCGANRSGPASAPILATIVERQEERHGTLSAVQAKMSSARSALRAAIWDEQGDVRGVHKAHPILAQLTSRQAWETFEVREWALGWRDDANKRPNTVQAAVGWVMLEQEMRLVLAHRIFDESPRARHLLRMVREVGEIREQRKRKGRHAAGAAKQARN